MADNVLLRHLDVPASITLMSMWRMAGMKRARKTLTTMKPEEVVRSVKASNLRGRGAPGSALHEVGFLPQDSQKPIYLCLQCR